MKIKRLLLIGTRNTLAIWLVAFMVFGGATGGARIAMATNQHQEQSHEENNGQSNDHNNGGDDNSDGDNHANSSNHENGHDNDTEHHNNHDHDQDHDNEHEHSGGNNSENNQNNQNQTEPSGSIRICKVILDSNGSIADVDAVSGGSFTIPGFATTTSFGPSAPDTLETTTITTQLEFNTRIFDSSTQNDAECVTYSNLAFGNYYYGAEIISDPSNWEAPLYHDVVGDYLYTVEYFHTYSGELFDDNSENDTDAYHSSNGHILIGQDQPNITLVVINKMKPASSNTDQDGEGDQGGQGGSNDEGGSGTGDGTGGTGNGTGGGSTSGSGSGSGADNGTGGGSGSNNNGGSTGGSSGTGGGSSQGGQGGGGGTIGGGVSFASSFPQGQVLGASTCGEYLNAYLRYGYVNNIEEVKKLQTFLNKELGISLVVSGFFDRNTESAVHTFQKKYAIEILNPWKIAYSTGIVYLTTRAQINHLSCEKAKTVLPDPLINWSENPETASIPKI